jgi:PAS domain S-box-containing protein
VPKSANASTHSSTTLQNRHTEALNQLEQYKLLVENIQDYAIFLLDPTGHIMTWNKGAQRFKGYRPDEIIGKHFSTFYMQEDIDAGKPARELELAQKMGRVEDEDWRVRKDGSKFWANVVITPLYNSEHELVAFAKVTRDLTERKAQEDAVRKANKRLIGQQRQLEKMNIAKDEFISLASHQLRTPATAIKQLLGMLLEGLYGDTPPDLRIIIEKAYTNNERQINIVNNLLRVAQLDSGKIILRRTTVDIQRLLEDITKEYAESAHASNHTIVYVPKTTKPIYADADVENLRMAICNLMDNAVKYTPEGGKIVLGLEASKNIVIISITDSGIGIGPEDIPKLFGKFVRIPNQLTQKVEGSGLGLYWVQQVIELHGGTVSVASELGAGTTFSIILPEQTHA